MGLLSVQSTCYYHSLREDFECPGALLLIFFVRAFIEAML